MSTAPPCEGINPQGSRSLTEPRWRHAFAALAAAWLAGGASAGDIPRIPLRTGLTILTAVHSSEGDYESIKTFLSEDAKSLRLKYASESAKDNELLDPADEYVQYRPHPNDPDKVIQTTTVYRTLLRSDLKSANHYLRLFAPPPLIPETIPGTTAVGTSARVLNELKAKGAAELITWYAILQPITRAEDAAENTPMNTPFGGTMHRVEKADVPVPVIVNGKLVDLPAVHVKGLMLDTDAEFWFLDDADNALTLRFVFDKDRLDVVRINFPGDSLAGSLAGQPDSGIEQQLANSGHADVYGIYFGFNSDLIRPESGAVLKEIAALLAKHPDWRLAVDGHTDNVGGAVANQALSERRAAAVKNALAERYHVAPERLDTAGHGLSRPKATNDTLQGRALNRRVELVRE